MDPHRCYQLKLAHIADLHHQAELARAARTWRQQCAPGRQALPALAARRLLAMLRRAPGSAIRNHRQGASDRGAVERHKLA